MNHIFKWLSGAVTGAGEHGNVYSERIKRNRSCILGFLIGQPTLVTENLKVYSLAVDCEEFVDYLGLLVAKVLGLSPKIFLLVQ